MNVEQLKELSNKYLIHAQALINIDGYLTPIIFIIDENDLIKPCTMKLETDEDEKLLLELLKQLSQTAKALILILDTYAIGINSNEVKPEKIKGHPKAMNVLNCFVYAKNISLIRQVSYLHKDNRYSFFDYGWDNLNDLGNYKNPYLS